MKWCVRRPVNDMYQVRNELLLAGLLSICSLGDSV